MGMTLVGHLSAVNQILITIKEILIKTGTYPAQTDIEVLTVWIGEKIIETILKDFNKWAIFDPSLEKKTEDSNIEGKIDGGVIEKTEMIDTQIGGMTGERRVLSLVLEGGKFNE